MILGRCKAVNGARIDASLELCENVRVELKVVAQIGAGKCVRRFVIVGADSLYYDGRVLFTQKLTDCLNVL